MKNKLISLFIAVALSVALLPVGCSTPQPPIDVNFKIVGDNACIQWDAVDGCDGYKVYKSESKYGQYSEVSSGIQKNTSYYDEDLYSYYRVVAVKNNGAEVKALGPFSYDRQTFGDNVLIYSPTDTARRVQNELDDTYESLRDTDTKQFSSKRVAVLFKSGDYPDLDIKTGYYTTMAGLDINPDNVKIGKLNNDGSGTLINFWRGIENLTINSNMTWAVSQATFLRRVQINGNLSLSHTEPSSGGFIADALVKGDVNSGSQQQWFMRNSQFGSWTGGVFNMVFVGSNGTLPTNATEGLYTKINSSDLVQEKPFLTFDKSEGYRVFVPAKRNDSQGISWGESAQGTYIPLSEFYVAHEDKDNSKTLNDALSQGKHLLFTPGVYKLDEPIVVSKENTIVMGMGLATLKVSDRNTDCLLKTADVGGIIMSGLLFDAGKSSKTLLTLGENKTQTSHAQNPVCLSDLFFRVGGATNATTSVDTCIVINQNDVLGDNFWVWRADHTYGVGWTKNPCKTGITVNGDNVTVYGLFVEHFLEYQTIWNGENGTTYFYQCELPYDVPNQSRWKSHNGTTNGYSAYKVGDDVHTHTAYGMGIYSYLRDSGVRLENAIETPMSNGIYMKNIIIVWFGGHKDSGIDHVINGYGGSADGKNKNSRYLLYNPS